MNAKQKELLKEFAKASGEDWVGETKDESIVDKIKKKVLDVIRRMQRPEALVNRT